MNAEISSPSCSFSGLRLESSTATVPTLVGMLGSLEKGLTQLAVNTKEETRGRALGKVFSRTVFHSGAASHSLCDEKQNTSRVSLGYFYI